MLAFWINILLQYIIICPQGICIWTWSQKLRKHFFNGEKMLEMEQKYQVLLLSEFSDELKIHDHR